MEGKGGWRGRREEGEEGGREGEREGRRERGKEEGDREGEREGRRESEREGGSHNFLKSHRKIPHLSVAMFPCLRSRHLHNFARMSFDHDVPVLAEGRALLRVRVRGT